MSYVSMETVETIFFLFAKISHPNVWEDARNLKSSTRCNNSHTYKKYMHSTGPATPTCVWVWRREQRRVQILTISVYLAPSTVCEYPEPACVKRNIKTLLAHMNENSHSGVRKKNTHIADIARATNKYGTAKTRFRFFLFPILFPFRWLFFFCVVGFFLSYFIAISVSSSMCSAVSVNAF